MLCTISKWTYSNNNNNSILRGKKGSRNASFSFGTEISVAIVTPDNNPYKTKKRTNKKWKEIRGIANKLQKQKILEEEFRYGFSCFLSSSVFFFANHTSCQVCQTQPQSSPPWSPPAGPGVKKLRNDQMSAGSSAVSAQQFMFSSYSFCPPKRKQNKTPLFIFLFFFSP